MAHVRDTPPTSSPSPPTAAAAGEAAVHRQQQQQQQLEHQQHPRNVLSAALTETAAVGTPPSSSSYPFARPIGTVAKAASTARPARSQYTALATSASVEPISPSNASRLASSASLLLSSGTPQATVSLSVVRSSLDFEGIDAPGCYEDDPDLEDDGVDDSNPFLNEGEQSANSSTLVRLQRQISSWFRSGHYALFSALGLPVSGRLPSLNTNTVNIAPSLLPDAILPLEPIFVGLGSVGDSLHPLPLNFANAVSPVTPVSSHQFLAIVEDVRAAIAEGIYPTRIAKGSSGSYFCRNRAGEIVGVFKPKNEEPYGHLNPKWTKWAHRNCLPCCFGRSCLIPNLGYLSEAAASYMDRRLGLNVVPRTEVVELASPSFFYSARDRRAYARGKPLPPKLGSFQLFLTGFKDATTFFKEGYESVLKGSPPGVGPTAAKRDTDIDRRASPNGNGTSSTASTSVESVGGATAHETFDSNGRSLSRSSSVLSLSSPAHPNNWSEQTQLEFQQGFERLVVLDYLIRNTDRGMDNWMIKYTAPATCSDVSEASTTASTLARGRSLRISGSTESLVEGRLKQRSLLSAAGAGSSSAGSDRSSSRSSSTDSLPLYTTALSPRASRDVQASGLRSPLANEFSSLPSPLSKDSGSDDPAVSPTADSVAPQQPSSPLVPRASAFGSANESNGSPRNSGLLSSRPRMSTATPITSVPPPSNSASLYVAAIDNGLAFPFKHPDRWRGYPYGWANLPIARIPFSASTRNQILHFLTSHEWWRETLAGLERIFRIDPDFSEAMWRRQRSVIRGEGYNLAEALRRSALGDVAGGSPWGLVRRPVVAVFEEFVEEHAPGSGVDADGEVVIVVGDDVEGREPARTFRRVRQRFETFSRSQPFFKNW